jgi:hypothetical protein
VTNDAAIRSAQEHGLRILVEEMAQQQRSERDITEALREVTARNHDQTPGLEQRAKSARSWRPRRRSK